MPGVFAGACRLSPSCDGLWNLISSSRPWPSGVCRNAKIRADAVEAHDAVRQAALDRSLAPQLEPELDEELGRGREVVDHDADVVHSLDRQVLDGSEGRGGEPTPLSSTPTGPRASSGLSSNTQNSRPITCTATL